MCCSVWAGPAPSIHGCTRTSASTMTKKDGDRVGPHLFCKAVCILRIHKPNSVHPISPGGIQPAIIIALCSAICKNPALFSVKCIRNMLYFYAVCFCDIQQKSLCFQLFQSFFHRIFLLDPCIELCSQFPQYELSKNKSCKKQKGPDKPVLCFLIVQSCAAG